MYVVGCSAEMKARELLANLNEMFHLSDSGFLG